MQNHLKKTPGRHTFELIVCESRSILQKGKRQKVSAKLSILKLSIIRNRSFQATILKYSVLYKVDYWNEPLTFFLAIRDVLKRYCKFKRCILDRSSVIVRRIEKRKTYLFNLVMRDVLHTVWCCKEILEKGFHISGAKSSQLILWRLYNNGQVGRAVIEKVAGLQVNYQVSAQKAPIQCPMCNMCSIWRSVLTDINSEKKDFCW